ncbi:MAG: hypothetical protein K0R65_15 [Crocinitomicaceae bacterium]|jgi:hypothetical protein|nr:hypothetical protein [Crocinitomicaceae bacterium]
MDSLAENNSEKLKSISEDIIKSGLLPSGSTYSQAAEICYSYLKKNYKNEYLYRNTIFQELITQNHSLYECITIPEFRVGQSKADLAVFNGTSTVYEIKTELDTLNRLKSQLEDYYNFFDLIYVVTYSGFVDLVKQLTKKTVGIYVLDEKDNLSLIRKATSNKKNIDKRVLMASLRKKEYTEIILNEFGGIPNVPNTKIYKECESLFMSLSKEKAHNYMVRALFSRKLLASQIELIEMMPFSLKSLSLTKRYSTIQCNNILQFLSKPLIV